MDRIKREKPPSFLSLFEMTLEVTFETASYFKLDKVHRQVPAPFLFFLLYVCIYCNTGYRSD